MFKSAISVKVITDSCFTSSNERKRITTLQLRYPRIVHSELMTHRVFSRNAGSSRAIPIAKFIKQVREDTAKPFVWTMNQPGMQGVEITDPALIAQADKKWLEAAYRAADSAEEMASLGLHKQVVNRILEPFQWISVIVTATDWDNWFALRNHKDADPTIRELARLMGVALAESNPDLLGWAEWHIPYLTAEEREALRNDDDLLPAMLKYSAARCARVSYLLHDGNLPSVEKDLKLYDSLIESDPRHASPVEHQARRATNSEKASGELSGNFNRDFVQYRKILEKGCELF